MNHWRRLRGCIDRELNEEEWRQALLIAEKGRRSYKRFLEFMHERRASSVPWAVIRQKVTWNSAYSIELNRLFRENGLAVRVNEREGKLFLSTIFYKDDAVTEIRTPRDSFKLRLRRLSTAELRANLEVIREVLAERGEKA